MHASPLNVADPIDADENLNYVKINERKFPELTVANFKHAIDTCTNICSVIHFRLFSVEEPEKDLMDEFLEQSARSLETTSSNSGQLGPGVEQSHDPEDSDNEEDEDRLVIAQEREERAEEEEGEEEGEEEEEEGDKLTAQVSPATHKLPPPLIKHRSPSR